MSTLVKIAKGSYCGNQVTNEVFSLVKDIKTGVKGQFITVNPNGNFGGNKDKIRINIDHSDHITYIDNSVKESDDEVMARIGERFDILHEMAAATTVGAVKGMVVTGAAGIGKSYGVIEELKKASLFNILKTGTPQYEVIKGSMSGIGLYTTLYNNSDENSVLVLDDCDSVFYDDITLNLLKAALDTTGKRHLHWTSASKYLEQEGIPNMFEFKGSIIFITNLNFDNIKSAKLQEHLAALQSRCHYLDLTIATTREKFLRIKQIYNTGALFARSNISEEQGNLIIKWIDENKESVRELSLRLAIKCTELIQVNSDKWERMAQVTLCK